MKPKLYRRRFIPDEKIHLKDDEILRLDDEVIITKWKTLNPRQDISYGISCVFLKANVKVSKIFDREDNFVYYYCDIVEVEKDIPDNSYIFNDLLVDVIIMPDGYVKVVDLDEIPEALEKNLISMETTKNILIYLDKLLQTIYKGEFHKLTDYLNLSGG